MKKILAYILFPVIIATAFSSITSITAMADTDGTDSSIYNIPKPTYLPGPDPEEENADENRDMFITDLIPRYSVTLGGFVASAAVLYLMVAGVRFFTAYGDEEAYEKAKKQVIFALVATLISLLAYTIVRIIIGIDWAGPT